jgi:aldehyde:ferredoxin oxidoreductase
VAGWHGRYWRFDLSTGKGEHVAIPERILRLYVGGVGLGTWILQRETRAGFDPLGPEAPIVFAFSPLVGTPLTTSAKFAIVAKSPLTGLVCDALSGSHFAIAGKRMGVDAIVVTGSCDAPSVLVGAALEPTDLWGCSAVEAAQALGARGRVAAIGVAGENGVRFATISNDGRHAGRGGLGAVMGAKRLKAIVVRGETATPLASPDEAQRLARDLSQRSLGPATAKYRELGTVSNLATFARVGALPTRNFRDDAFDADAFSVDALGAGRAHERASCASCTIGCEHRYSAGTRLGRVEYESLFALGPLCGIEDPDAVLEASRRCDVLGLDTVSAGGTIAFAMECGERGLLEGAPGFGDAAGLLALLEDIALRRGLGALLAEGSRRAAASIGGDAPDFAPHVKGLELPGYEPRALQTLALGLAVGTRGADHNKSSAYELDFSDRVDRLHGDARAARLAIEPEDRAALLDCLILCKFLRGVFGDLYADSAELLRAVTGQDYDADELRAVARRVVDLRKAFNVREGWHPADDTLPRRLLEEPIAEGPVAGARLTRARLERMVRSYNRARGWSADGVPSDEALRALRLGEWQ